MTMNMHAIRVAPESSPSDDVRHLIELRDHLRKSLEIVEAHLCEHPVSSVGAADLMRGYRAIGACLGMTPRQVQVHVEAGRLPTFKMGRIVCARRSSLDAWMAGAEAAAQTEG